MSLLFSSFEVGGMTLKNRIVMSPMCQYSCVKEDGKVNDWHKVHYSSRAVGQVGLIIVEATSVTPQGRISVKDLGIWEDDQIRGLKEIVDLVHLNGSKAGIQLSHAGRKAEVTGPIIAPSSIPFSAERKVPLEMNLEDIKATIASFKEGARRADEAGFDMIELHGAHGYLINEFLSPLSNKREDTYGGSRDRRFRFFEELIGEIKKVWNKPIFVRISATEYEPEGNNIDDYVYYSNKMKKLGVDFIDCSSGGVIRTPIHVYPGYQVPYAEKIRREVCISTGAVGLITSGIQAEEILQSSRADLIFLARELLRDPYWPRTAALEINAELDAPEQYSRAWDGHPMSSFLKKSES